MAIEGVSDDDQAALLGLALDLRRSWREGPEELWGRIDADEWSLTHNPWLVLATASHRHLAELFADAGFVERFRYKLGRQRDDQHAPRWFAGVDGRDALTHVAYFSMEYLLSEALPIYSGGLGNVAGDQLKAASDLGVPVVAVGLLYQQGYFRQRVGLDGRQQALYPFNEPSQLPVLPLRDAAGEWLRVEVPIGTSTFSVRAWTATVGQRTLYLLDANDPTNPPALRTITSELYGGGPELRLAQEIVLGIGGWRLLRALGLDPEVVHLNEGHCAFALVERARDLAARLGLTFAQAWTAARAGTLFTTHTPVDAGFDRFAPELVERLLCGYATHELGIGVDELLALGRRDTTNPDKPFNTAYVAIHGAGAVNGVSALHGQVSRALFAPLFPRRPLAEVPVGHVTNGVHVPSWDVDVARPVWDDVCGRGRWRGADPEPGTRIGAIDDERLWAMRGELRERLVRFARLHARRHLAELGIDHGAVEATEHAFDPNALTLGFARRFATYKRPNLLLADPDRLARLLSDPDRPVQLFVAGKAHPADQAGVDLVAEWVAFSQRPDVRWRVAFLPDYDAHLAGYLVSGVDVWINTPRRPWEASGTSGMKVLANGGLNLSVLDGWWAEAYEPEVGWAVGDGAEHDPGHDGVDAAELYDRLEREVVASFYERDASGLPRAWLTRVRASMQRLTPRFSADRTVRDYTTAYYLPLAAAYRRRVADGGALARRVEQWRHDLAAGFPQVRVAGHHRTEATGAGGDHRVTVQLYLDGLAPEWVAVELYADADPAHGDLAPRVVPFRRTGTLVGAANGHCYEAVAPGDRPLSHYSTRVLPACGDAFVPLEAPQILWVE